MVTGIPFVGDYHVSDSVCNAHKGLEGKKQLRSSSNVDLIVRNLIDQSYFFVQGSCQSLLPILPGELDHLILAIFAFLLCGLSEAHIHFLSLIVTLLCVFVLRGVLDQGRGPHFALVNHLHNEELFLG